MAIKSSYISLGMRRSAANASAAFCSIFLLSQNLCCNWSSWPTKNKKKLRKKGERGRKGEWGNPSFHSPLLFAPPSPTHNAPHTHTSHLSGHRGLMTHTQHGFYVIGADCAAATRGQQITHGSHSGSPGIETTWGECCFITHLTSEPTFSAVFH